MVLESAESHSQSTCIYILADELDPFSVLLSKCLKIYYCNLGHISDEIYMRNEYVKNVVDSPDTQTIYLDFVIHIN